MSTELITLEVDSDAARAFRSVSDVERSKLQALLGVWLIEYAKADGASLNQIMDEMSLDAQSRGLTPEILSTVLEER